MDVESDGKGIPLPLTDDELLDEEMNSSVSDSTGAVPKDGRPAPPPPSPPLPTPPAPNPKQSSDSLRHKAYPDDSKGPWVVFFRPKKKPLNIKQIEKDLFKRFSSVIDILRVRPDKLRVNVGNLKQANEIVACELFTLEYRVYIPSHNVEIEGVVTEASMTCDDFLKRGVGVFKNPALPEVKILDCSQMHSTSLVGTKKTYTPSDSYRVTFSGSALPDYVKVGRVRIPVRLFVPKVMHCTNCKLLGHTASFCGNRPRCDQCGEKHTEGPCRTPPKCVYCSGTPHALADCPKYKQQGEKLKRSLKARSQRSFAEILKTFNPLPRISPSNNSNQYNLLPVDEDDSDTEVGEGSHFVFKGPSRKRARNFSQQTKKNPHVDSQTTLEKSRGRGNAPKGPPPGFKPFVFDKDFPGLPGSSKTPDVPTLKPEQSGAMFTLSGIVDSILDAFSISDPLRKIIDLMLPILKTLLKQLASKWPLIGSIVSFDG